MPPCCFTGCALLAVPELMFKHDFQNNICQWSKRCLPGAPSRVPKKKNLIDKSALRQWRICKLRAWLPNLQTNLELWKPEYLWASTHTACKTNGPSSKKNSQGKPQLLCLELKRCLWARASPSSYTLHLERKNVCRQNETYDSMTLTQRTMDHFKIS